MIASSPLHQREQAERKHQYDRKTARAVERSLQRTSAGRWDGRSDPGSRIIKRHAAERKADV